MLEFLNQKKKKKLKFESYEHCEPIYILISKDNWNDIIDYFEDLGNIYFKPKEDKYFMLFGIKTIYSPALSNEDIFLIK